MRARLDLEKSEHEERLRARKEETRKPQETSSGGTGFLNHAPSRSPSASYNQKHEPVRRQGDKDGHKVELRQPENNPAEDTIPLTHEPEEITMIPLYMRTKIIRENHIAMHLSQSLKMSPQLSKSLVRIQPALIAQR
jgi:hypothetical protein